MSSHWDARWMDVARLAATWSKDRSRSVGAVIIDRRQHVVALGWNGFPRGINDDVGDRHERPAKYLWTEHAERNAIFNAAASGNATLGCTMYLVWFPCADCARAIIQAGIESIVAIEPDWGDPKYSADFAVVREMLSEAGVGVRFVDGEAPRREARHG